MKKRRLKKSAGIAVMLAAAVVLLAFSTIGGARAALNYFSETYTSQFAMFDIGITLLENGNEVNARNFNKDSHAFDVTGSQELLTGIEEFKFGTKYDEKLSVRNTGTIDEYVVLTVRRYWVQEVDGEAKKRTDLDPKLIKLNFTPGNHWIIDEANTDPNTERTILIYDTPLKKGEETDPATDWITVDSAIKAVVETVTTTKDETTGMTTIVTTYSYDGLKFVLEAEAEGVQTHNAQDAIHSAWGRRVTIDPATGKITGVQ